MAKKPSRKTLKNKAWKIFSEYIRRSYADEDGCCKCVTCGKVDHWKNMQAGHSVGGRTNAVLFHEEIVHPQCAGCNIFKNGAYAEYTLYMIDRYGREKFEQLLALKNTTTKITEADLMRIITLYSNRLEALK